MTLDDFRRLNFREAGSWPLAAKIVILSILAVLILAAGAFFDSRFASTGRDLGSGTMAATDDFGSSTRSACQP